MESEADGWRSAVELHFGFLEQYGYVLRQVDDSSWWEISAIYASEANAVLVKKSREFMRVELELVRLTADGEVPPVDVWVGPTSNGRALFDNVVEARARTSLPRWMRGTSSRAADRALATWARLLREVAPDFLDGSGACIDEAHALVLQRVAKRPQVLTISLPSTATAEEEAAAVEEARTITPEYVAIKTQRYRHRA